MNPTECLMAIVSAVIDGHTQAAHDAARELAAHLDQGNVRDPLGVAYRSDFSRAIEIAYVSSGVSEVFRVLKRVDLTPFVRSWTRFEMLSDLGHRLAGLSDHKIDDLEVYFFPSSKQINGEELVTLSVPQAIDYLSNSITNNGESDWSKATAFDMRVL